MADIAFEKDLSVTETGIGGLMVVDLAVHGDSRGWFKENWQRAKMCALGIPDLKVVQNNVSYNEKRGVTRGIHAEPRDKFISVARGSVFGAWVDLREGSATYGKVFTCTLDPSRAIYVSRGVAKDFDFCDIDTFDMSDPEACSEYDWSLCGTVINCGACTAVVKAETPEGRVVARKANATCPALFARTCAGRGTTLPHVSSDYAFDGTAEVHDEDEPLSPLSVYGQTKADGDIVVAGCSRRYIMRSSWVIGEGHNFVKTMKGLSDRGADPEDKLDKITVVDDQLGRLTFTRDMAASIFHVLGTHALTGPTTAPAPARSGPGSTSPAPFSRPPTATKWSPSAPPTTTRSSRAPSPRARSTPISTCPSSRHLASICRIGTALFLCI